MNLLRDLVNLQHEQGWLAEEALANLAQRHRVPLHRLEELASFYPQFRRKPPKQITIRLCRDVVCAMAGSAELRAEVVRHLADRGDIEFQEVSCLGRCDAAPAVSFNDLPCTGSISELVGKVDCLTTGPVSESPLRHSPTAAAGAPQTSVVTVPPGKSRKWQCDPYPTEADRYGTVHRLGREMATVGLGILREAELRGLGGAGFPTARKWEMVRTAPGATKYVICNADESEPGTFKDREILHDLPHLVVEGMVLAALTVGAERGYVYLRHEYSRERPLLEAAIADARQRAVLGADAAGSGQPFDIEIFVSPGGYILGEETALLEALEDRRGEPRIKPPYPGTSGLHGQPTLINNVETFAMATAIVARGADWWKSQGRRGCVGLKFASISGDVQRPGVYEIPLGTTVRELIEMAGGLPPGAALRAFLPGGASSHFLPAEKVDTRLDFEAMKAAGSMLGTAAVIIISDHHDLFELASNLVRFFHRESCGKCVPCRLGCEKAVQLLQESRAGRSALPNLSLVAELAATMQQTSICGLGQVALNPVLSLLANVPQAKPIGWSP